MEEGISREKILGRIRSALDRKTAMPFPEQSGNEEVFKISRGELAVQFETEFTRLLGKFYAFKDYREMIREIGRLGDEHRWQNCTVPQNLLSKFPEISSLPFVNTTPALDADVVLTDCECLLARTGTVVLSSAQETGRAVPVYTPVHVILAYQQQLLPDIRHSISFLKTKYPVNMPSMLAFSSGPSRTGDIEKTLVVGVHGPGEVILFLLPDQPEDSPLSQNDNLVT